MDSSVCIYESTDSKLWLGSYTAGLAYLDKTRTHCKYIDAFKNKRIYCIKEDDAQNLYVGTMGDGLYVLNKNGLIQHITSESFGRSSIFSGLERLGFSMGINALQFDNQKNLWIGHYKGVSCYNIYYKKFIDMTAINNKIKGRICYTMIRDYKKQIWIGTPEGLFCYNTKTKKVKTYTTSNGLPNNVICGITEDDKHHLWCSTYRGIFNLNPETGECFNYFSDDGLQGNEFTHGAVFKDKTGKIFFGGTNGITNYYPSDINPNKYMMRLTITGFYIYNQPINASTLSNGKAIISKSVQESDTFRLSYVDNTFTIEFSIMDYVNPERIIYRYKLDGLNNEWRNTLRAGLNKVTYNNLQPGKYTLYVQAIDGNNRSAIKKIQIIISPPWYISGWAYLLYSLFFIILSVIVADYIRGRNLLRKQMQEKHYFEQINEAKLQFFVNISHEIRTPLTLIINPLDKLISENKDDNLRNVYMLMHRNGERILRLINQLLDVRRLDKGQMHIKCRETDIVGFIKDVMQTFESLSHKKNIKFQFLHADDNLKVWIDLNNFDKVLMNLLSNAFKFTPDNGEITVVLSKGCNIDSKDLLKYYFEIDVIDSGIGLDPNKIEHIFDRFYQISNDITNTSIGTGIGLNLAKSLVELHHGTITAVNRDDVSGSKFIIKLPLGCNHLKTEELMDPEEMPTNAENLKALEFNNNIIAETLLPDDNSAVTKNKTKTKYRILIVEDEEDILNYIQLELSSDYHILTCNNGSKALEIALHEKPDLIISDIMMPEMDGLTLCKKLKQNANINHIPIILLTAKTRIEDKLEGLETGADAYFGKPFILEELKVSVANLISNRELLRNKFNGSQEQEDKINKIKVRTADEVLMEKIMNSINAHIADSDFSVEQLAEDVFLSRVHLNRRLKELTNQSPRDFIRTIRLRQAAVILSEKNMSVSEVAYATGFNTPSHFSLSFRELYGMTPTEYYYEHHKTSQEDNKL